MFNWFKKSAESKPQAISLEDLNGEPLQVGGKVESLRYELGISTIEQNGDDIVYKSDTSGDSVSYIKMVDAVTKRQKVFKK
jgi:hypothetical protein